MGIKKIFEQRAISRDGRYKLHLYNQDLSEHLTELDEYFPCDDAGTPLFARPMNNEMWSLLLEKGAAKVFGNYAKLNGGWMSTAFRTFATAKAQEHKVKHEHHFFHFLQQSDQKNHLMAAACFNGYNGLVSMHAYSLLQ